MEGMVNIILLLSKEGSSFDSPSFRLPFTLEEIFVISDASYIFRSSPVSVSVTCTFELLPVDVILI